MSTSNLSNGSVRVTEQWGAASENMPQDLFGAAVYALRQAKRLHAIAMDARLPDAVRYAARSECREIAAHARQLTFDAADGYENGIDGAL